MQGHLIACMQEEAPAWQRDAQELLANFALV